MIRIYTTLMRPYKLMVQLFVISWSIIWSSSTVYSQCAELPITNMVRNGSFTEGNNFFESGYNYCNEQNCLYPEGLYAVGPNSTRFHSGFVGFDHTTGNGNFMVVNGSPTPNTIIWTQKITVKPNVQYNFSSWVSSLVANGSIANLQFQINGVAIGGIFSAPNSLNQWVRFDEEWNSGTSDTARITILNQNRDAGGNDFGLDDISFIEVCPTQQPLLGNDISICGLGNIDLLSNIVATPTTTITWSTGATGTGANAPTSIDITEPGIYWVCVQDGSCIKSDSLEVTAGFNVNLGPDLIICTQSSFILDSDHQNSFTTYKWYKDNMLLPDSARRSLLVTSPGTYRVEVTDPSCGLTRTDQVTVTSQAAIPKDVNFCPPAVPSFAVARNPEGGFKWYDNLTSGNVVGRGDSIKYAANATKTLYAEDTTAFYYTVGAKSKFPDVVPSKNDNTEYFIFDAYETFTLKSVTVYAEVYSPNLNIKAGVTLRNSSGGLITQKLVDLVGPPIVPVGNVWAFTVNVDLPIPVGTDMRLSAEGSIGKFYFAQSQDPNVSNNPDWNAYQVPGIIRIKGTDLNATWAACDCYGVFYNWEIEKGTKCARTPVTANYYCPLPLDWLYVHASRIPNTGHIALEWRKSHVMKGNSFLIERSTNGIDFETIGHTDVLQKAVYEYTDPTASYETSYYYRIKETNTQGSVQSTSTVVAVKGEASVYSLHPNPSTGLLNLKVTQGTLNKIEIFSKQGLLITTQSFEPSQELIVDASYLKPDTYIIKIHTQSDLYVQTFIKK